MKKYDLGISMFSLCLLASLLYSHASYAATYYVSTSGSDSNSGATITAPWRTVQHAASTLVAGDTALIRGGTYSESNITFTNSGTNGNPITLKAYTGEIPIVDGGFTSGSSGIPIFEIDNRSYITLDGLTITRGVLANVRLGYNNTTTNVIIQNCDISNFVFNDNSAEIYVNTNTDNITIRNNKLHDVQGLPTTNNNAAGIIIFHGKTLTITNNEIYNTHSGIYYKHSTDPSTYAPNPVPVTTIQNNLIYNQQTSGDNSGRGMYISASYCVISNNVVYNSDTGLKFFDASATCPNVVTTNNQILHNTIAGTINGVVLNGPSSGCPGAVNTIVRNNLIYNFSNASEFRGLSVWPYNAAVDSSSTTEEYNLVYSSVTSAPITVLSVGYTTSTLPASIMGNTAASLSIATYFRDYTKKDYTLLPTSPGTKAASDGTDMGANIALVGVKVAPSTPAVLPVL